MASRGETVETVADFILGGSKITADGDGSQEIKRHLLLGRKVMTHLDSILKSRDITLPTKVHLVKGMVFPVMYGCESWTIKKAESWRIDAFELWFWGRLLRVPWTARRRNQSLSLPSNVIGRTYFKAESPILWPPDAKSWITWKDPDARKDWRQEKGGQRMRRLDGITDSMKMNLGKVGSWWWTGRLSMLPSIGSQRVGHDWATKQNWTEYGENAKRMCIFFRESHTGRLQIAKPE